MRSRRGWGAGDGRSPGDGRSAADVTAPSAVTAPRLELRDIHKRFGGVDAVSGVSMAVQPGTVAGLIGPNGAGKTTVVNLVSGQFPPDSGDIFVDGRSILGLRPHQVAAGAWPGPSRRCASTATSPSSTTW